jgi:hypothetical protein
MVTAIALAVGAILIFGGGLGLAVIDEQRSRAAAERLDSATTRVELAPARAGSSSSTQPWFGVVMAGVVILSAGLGQVFIRMARAAPEPSASARA